jgi:hypothetical protein
VLIFSGRSSIEAESGVGGWFRSWQHSDIPGSDRDYNNFLKLENNSSCGMEDREGLIHNKDGCMDIK